MAFALILKRIPMSCYHQMDLRWYITLEMKELQMIFHTETTKYVTETLYTLIHH